MNHVFFHVCFLFHAQFRKLIKSFFDLSFHTSSFFRILLPFSSSACRKCLFCSDQHTAQSMHACTCSKHSALSLPPFPSLSPHPPTPLLPRFPFLPLDSPPPTPKFSGGQRQITFLPHKNGFASEIVFPRMLAVSP